MDNRTTHADSHDEALDRLIAEIDLTLGLLDQTTQALDDARRAAGSPASGDDARYDRFRDLDAA